MRRRHNYTTGTLLVIGGTVIGAALGLLFARKSGRETREAIVSFAKIAGRNTDKVIRDLAENVAGMAHSVGKRIGDMVHAGKEISDEARRQMAEYQPEQKVRESQRHRLWKRTGST